MKYRSLNFERALFCLFLFVAIPVIYATANNGKKKEAHVKFTSVIDNLTQRPIVPNFKVLNAADSTAVDASYSGVDESFTLTLPDILLDYYVIVNGHSTSLSFSAPDNNTEFKADTLLITSRQLQDAKGYMTLPPMTLKREYAKRGVNLSEATVVASKVVFYHKGDTLIYNADAFVTPEGSTLDALITQLPGVKIDEHGVITANGRKVENLLLNGKDLFNGKGEILLENLPAYTVKNIALYEKDGEFSEFLGRKAGDEQYVMDVRLKRDYHAGWLGNAEAGYGTQNKYLAKFFALRFDDNFTLESHFKANNLSDISKSMRWDDSWSPANMLTGVITNQTGGLAYTAEKLPHEWNVRGSIDAVNIENNLMSGAMCQNYYPGGDTYDYRQDKKQSKSLTLETRHFIIKPIKERWRLYVVPEFRYSRMNNSSFLYAASFNESKDSLMSLIRDGSGAALSHYTDFITRSVKESLEKSHSINAGIGGDVTLKTKTSGLENNVTFRGGVKYGRSTPERFDRYNIEYEASPASMASQYFKGFPNHNTEYKGAISFQHFINKSLPDHIQITYTYTSSNAVTTSDLYLLDHVSGFDWSNSLLGVLPSVSQYKNHLDTDQSYNTRYREDKHDICIFGYSNIMSTRGVWYVSAILDMPYKNRNLEYFSLNGNQHVSRHSFIPDIDLTCRYTFFDKERMSKDKNWQAKIELGLNRTPLEISMLDAVDRWNTTDPLFLRIGNPDLKNGSRNSLHLSVSSQQFKSKLQQNFRFRLEYLKDAIAEARFYNPSTGVTTSRPNNIDGNRSFAVDYGLTTPLFKKTNLTFSTNTSANFLRSRDISAVIESPEITNDILDAVNVVNTTSIGEELKLDYTFGKHSVRAFGKMQYNDYHSHEQGFSRFTSWTGNYGVSGVVALPSGFGLSSNLTVYTRRGFADSRLNTSDVVWNARLTKSVMKGSMILAVDAYDMLRQLSNITYTVNAQARTEVVTNVVPAYVLFHVQYRFNRNPKM